MYLIHHEIVVPIYRFVKCLLHSATTILVINDYASSIFLHFFTLMMQETKSTEFAIQIIKALVDWRKNQPFATSHVIKFHERLLLQEFSSKRSTNRGFVGNRSCKRLLANFAKQSVAICRLASQLDKVRVRTRRIRDFQVQMKRGFGTLPSASGVKWLFL